MPQTAAINSQPIRDRWHSLRRIRRNTDLRPDTLEEEGRRVHSLLTTEDPALVYGCRRGGIVLEVLLVYGCEFESQTPLLRDHNPYSVTPIVGSVTDHVVNKMGLPAGCASAKNPTTRPKVSGEASGKVTAGSPTSRLGCQSVSPIPSTTKSYQTQQSCLASFQIE